MKYIVTTQCYKPCQKRKIAVIKLTVGGKKNTTMLLEINRFLSFFSTFSTKALRYYHAS